MAFQVGAAAAGAVLASIAEVSKDVANFHNIMNNAQSLVGLTKAARVDPPTLVDSDCIGLDYISDVLQSLQSRFTGYWLQGLDIISDVGGCSVLSILDSINPNRDPNYAEFQKSITKRFGIERLGHMSVESYKFSLPMPGKSILAKALEADGKNFTDIAAVANLAVGKLVNVTIKRGAEKHEMSIAIRLMVAEMPRQTMLALVGDDSQNKSFTERFFSWRAGTIGTADLLFCNDLIRERKRMLAKDKNEIYTAVRNRQMAHKKAGIISGKASAAEASNIYVISKDTTDEIEAQFGLSIENFSHRTKIFEQTAAMMIAVIDRDYARVTFYDAGIKQSSNLGVQDIKSSNKNSGPNIMDIFQAYKEGAAPRY